MNDDELFSKIIVLDNNPQYAWRLRHFCEANKLLALKVRKGAEMSVLSTNVDLGGILLAEDYAESREETMRIARAIRAARPELPIILRRESATNLEGFPAGAESLFCAVYDASDMDALKKVIDEYIFCLVYPNVLLRGISEITESVLSSQFPTLKTTSHTPYIVRDRVIFGELFSLIQLESPWCRGYMMLQTEEEPLLELIGRDGAPGTVSSFRSVNDLLSEITNLVWGSFKNRFIGNSDRSSASRIEVPIIVNHKHRYVSFGTEKPQLCFRFTLSDEITGRSTKLYERFIFNLNWSPDNFQEIPKDVEDLVDAGELELL